MSTKQLAQQIHTMYSLPDKYNLPGDVEELLESRIGFLRQWLNEKPSDLLVTNADIKYWLFGGGKV